MPAYLYTGPDDGRYYPTLGVTPEPGQTYDLAEDPGDGAWTLAPPPAPARAATAKTTASTSTATAPGPEVTPSA